MTSVCCLWSVNEDDSGGNKRKRERERMRVSERVKNLSESIEHKSVFRELFSHFLLLPSPTLVSCYKYSCNFTSD